MALNIAAQLERDNALADVQAEVEIYGDEIKLRVRDESQVNRDTYNSIKSRDLPTEEIVIKAYPITFNPNRYQLNKAGLKEECEALIWIPMKSLTDNNIFFEDIDLLRTTIILKDNKYGVKEKSYTSQFLDTFLYVTLGLRRSV